MEMENSSCCIGNKYLSIRFDKGSFFVEDMSCNVWLPYHLSQADWLENILVKVLHLPIYTKSSDIVRNEYGTCQIQKPCVDRTWLFKCAVWPRLRGLKRILIPEGNNKKGWLVLLLKMFQLSSPKPNQPISNSGLWPSYVNEKSKSNQPILNSVPRFSYAEMVKKESSFDRGSSRGFRNTTNCLKNVGKDKFEMI